MKELVLLVDRRDATLGLEGGSLYVRRPGEPPEFVPLGLLGLVIVHGNPQVEVRALRALGERNIPAVLLPVRGRGEGVWIGQGLGASIAVRIAQHRAFHDSRRIEIAAELVRSKLEAQAALARQRGLEEASERILSGLPGLAGASGLSGIMGIEGAAASAWWGVLSKILPAEWEFKGRNRRPPRDPVNALLSLGYTLLAAEMASAIRQFGLDPALGFLHDPVPGRETLTLDLMEPLRAAVDAWVLGLIDGGVLHPGQFQNNPADGCRLSKEARGHFYAAWADARMEWPDPLRPGESIAARCRAQVRWLRDRLGPYDPMTGAATDG